MNLPKKKVLVITYYFPPSGGAGVQRTLKFVKYLREFGWEPVVLTVRDADYPVYDESLFSEIPALVKVYRRRIFEPYRLYRKFTGRRGEESTDIATLTLDQESKSRFSERMSEWVRATFFVPDARIAWRFVAPRFAEKVIRTEKVDAILSSAPPYTAHLIGSQLKRKTGLPWVADFRDSWIGWLSTPQWRPWPARVLERRMERSVLASADKILTVSNGVKDDLLSRHPEFDDQRWRLLLNGFDGADFDEIERPPKDDRITITYVGSLYGPRHPEYLLQALEKLDRETPDLENKLCVRLIGRIGEPIMRRIATSPVKHLFDLVPYVSHNESLVYLLRGHVSLLIIDDAPANRGILTGKLFEYIGAGNPILALAPEGEAAELIRSQKLGWVAPPRNEEAIRRILLKILKRKRWRKAGSSRHWDVQKQFERRSQTAELAKILDELTSKDVRTQSHFQAKTAKASSKPGEPIAARE